MDGTSASTTDLGKLSAYIRIYYIYPKPQIFEMEGVYVIRINMIIINIISIPIESCIIFPSLNFSSILFFTSLKIPLKFNYTF